VTGAQPYRLHLLASGTLALQSDVLCNYPLTATTIRLVSNKAVQLVQLLRSTKREKRLGTVILFVTSRCNSFCRTCFYHEELNRRAI
jgi:hypothetical protein